MREHDRRVAGFGRRVVVGLLAAALSVLGTAGSCGDPADVDGGGAPPDGIVTPRVGDPVPQPGPLPPGDVQPSTGPLVDPDVPEQTAPPEPGSPPEPGNPQEPDEPAEPTG